MPYHLEKGPLLSVLDDFFNGAPPSRLATALHRLRAGEPLADIGPFDSPNLYRASYPRPYQNAGQLKDHFNREWLGHPPPINPTTANRQTGHWQFYKGPVEAIMRETLIRAIELVLGVSHGDAVPNTPQRHWPIDFWWKCPQPWFEGWVSWRQEKGGNGCGKVTVIFATPSDDGVVLREPATEATPAPDVITTETEGSWLVSALRHRQTTQLTVVPTPKGLIVFPTTWTEDVDDVLVFSPKFGSGGAVNGGFPYTGVK
jgi:hypothetical protein